MEKWANWSDIHLTGCCFCLLFLYLFVRPRCVSSHTFLKFELSKTVQTENVAGISTSTIVVHVWDAAGRV